MDIYKLSVDVEDHVTVNDLIVRADGLVIEIGGEIIFEMGDEE